MHKRTIATIVAAILIVSGHYLGMLAPVERLIVRALAPFERLTFRGSNRLERYYDERTSNADYRALYEEMRVQKERLEAENAGLQLLRKENESLREQLEFYQQHAYRKAAANVISRASNLGTSRIMTIDAGSDRGVVVDAPVVADNGILVGKVFAVEPALAHAYILTDERSEIAAAVNGRAATEGLVVGEGGLAARLTFVAQDQPLAEGELIVTSGLEPEVPAGLVIGTVRSIEQEPNDVFQSAVIAPAVRVNELTVVSVILP